MLVFAPEDIIRWGKFFPEGTLWEVDTLPWPQDLRYIDKVGLEGTNIAGTNTLYYLGKSCIYYKTGEVEYINVLDNTFSLSNETPIELDDTVFILLPDFGFKLNFFSIDIDPEVINEYKLYVVKFFKNGVETNLSEIDNLTDTDQGALLRIGYFGCSNTIGAITRISDIIFPNEIMKYLERGLIYS